MKKNKLITIQQWQLEYLKEIIEENEKIKKKLRGRLYGIGQPLNDNILKFNKVQIKWLIETANIIDEIKTL